ncbi:hypothetical protein ACFL5V_10335 [Fibrobacterota bacterium]
MINRWMLSEMNPRDAAEILYQQDGVRSDPDEIKIYRDKVYGRSYLLTDSYVPRVERILGCKGKPCSDEHKIQLFRNMGAKYSSERKSIVITATHDLDPADAYACKDHLLPGKRYAGKISCRDMMGKGRKRSGGKRPRVCRTKEEAARVISMVDGGKTGEEDIYTYTHGDIQIFTHRNYVPGIERLLALQTLGKEAVGSKLKRLDVNNDMVITDAEDLTIMYPKFTGKRH